MQLSYIGFLSQFGIIYFFLNSVDGVAIRGDNVREATEREFPFVVAISDVISNDVNAVSPGDRQFCTGSLITRKHVLTAEHCVLREQLKRVEILAGSIDLDLCKVYEAETWITYQQWKYKKPEKFPLLVHDVAVITLKNYVNDANVQPAIIPKFEPEDLFGAKVKLVGWGLTKGYVRPNILRTVNMKVLTKTECNSQISQLTKQNISTHDWDLCTSSDPWASGDCGDSGGPLVNERNELIGVFSAVCPHELLILKAHSLQTVFLNKLLKKTVNLHSSLHYYGEFVAHFTNIL